MKKTFLFSCIAIILGLSLIEGSMRLFAKPGTFDYAERCNFEQGLRQFKGKDEKRIFLYGESTMHGSHLYTKSTIKDWIRFYLEDLVGKSLADRVTIINYGRVGADSDYIVQSFIDTVVHRPDAAVMYSVHNDFVFLENRQEHLKQKKFSDHASSFFKSLSKKSVFLSTVRRYSVKRKLDKALAKGATKEKAEDKWYDEKARRNREPESNLFDPSSEDFAIVTGKWQENIGRAIKTAKAKRTPLIFLNGIARFQKFPPYESIHAKALTSEQLSQWEYVHAKADRAFERGQYDVAINYYEDALTIDSQYAQTYYQLAQNYQRIGKLEEAYDYYVEANDRDFFPSRAPSAVNDFYAKVDRENGPPIHVLDIDQTFRANSPGEIVDRDLIVDNIHPTIRGQALIALDIVKLIYGQDLLFPKEQWHWENLKPYEEMAARIGLDDNFRFEMAMYNGNFIGSYYEEAVAFMTEALRYNPNSVLAKSQLAWTYWLKGEADKALRLYRELEVQAPEQFSRFIDRQPDIAALLHQI